MSRFDEYSFHQSLSRLRTEVIPRVLRRIEEALAAADPTRVTSFEGQGRIQINEAQVRTYIIDPMLEALGWKINDPEDMVVEGGVDPSDRKHHRRFLDYFGVGRRDECQASLMVEAKRLSHMLPTHDEGMDLRHVMTEALKEAKRLKGSTSARRKRGPLSAEWLEVLTTLFDYVMRLDSSSHGAPRKVLLTNGEWLIVFINPKKTLALQDFAANDLLVVSNLEQASGNALALFSHLSFESFTDGLEQKAFDLCRFVPREGDPLPAAFAVEISTGQVGQRPLMDVLPTVAVQIPGGGWLRFRNPAVEPRLLAKDAELPAEMEAMQKDAEALVAELAPQRELLFLEAVAFEEAVAKDPPFPSSRLARRIADDKFVIYLGKESRPFVDPGEFAGCRYHFYGEAQKEGVAAEPIYKRSTAPLAYFPSGAIQHCAHGGVHALRARKCAIRAMDEYLCCRACALQTRCWPDGAMDLPCVKQQQDTDVIGPAC